MFKIRRKTRNLITVFLVGAASLFFVAYFLEIPRDSLLRFLGATLLFVLGLMLLAGIAVALIKGLGKLFRR